MVKLRMSADGCYDNGNTYWGQGSPIYWAKSIEDFETTFSRMLENQKEPVQIFIRATSRLMAKAKILGMLPNARFYN